MQVSTLVTPIVESTAGMGENNAARNRKLSIPRETLMAAAAIYENMYGNNNGKDGSRSVPASFQVIFPKYSLILELLCVPCI